MANRLDNYRALCRRASNEWLVRQLLFAAERPLLYDQEGQWMTPDERQTAVEHTKIEINELASRLNQYELQNV